MILRLFTCIMIMAPAASALARPVALLPYDRLFKEADVVVIAAAQDTIDTDAHPDYTG
jgi:hypothetical protein